MALSEPLKMAALQSASDAIDAYAVSKGGWREVYTEQNVPENLKVACCIEALELTRPETQARRKAQEQGLRSVSIGGASETYADTTSHAVALNSQTKSLIKPLVKWATGGVNIV